MDFGCAEGREDALADLVRHLPQDVEMAPAVEGLTLLPHDPVG